MAYEIEGDSYGKYLVNKYNQPNRTMRDTLSTSDVVPIIPQEETVQIDLNFYYSKNVGVRETALEDDKYASAKLDFLIVSFVFQSISFSPLVDKNPRPTNQSMHPRIFLTTGHSSLVYPLFFKKKH